MKIKVIRDARKQPFEENVNHFLDVIEDPKHSYEIVDVKLSMSQEGDSFYYNALITYRKCKMMTMSTEEREKFVDQLQAKKAEEKTTTTNENTLPKPRDHSKSSS